MDTTKPLTKRKCSSGSEPSEELIECPIHYRPVDFCSSHRCASCNDSFISNKETAPYFGPGASSFSYWLTISFPRLSQHFCGCYTRSTGERMSSDFLSRYCNFTSPFRYSGFLVEWEVIQSHGIFFQIKPHLFLLPKPTVQVVCHILRHEIPLETIDEPISTTGTLFPFQEYIIDQMKTFSFGRALARLGDSIVEKGTPSLPFCIVPYMSKLSSNNVTPVYTGNKAQFASYLTDSFHEVFTKNLPRALNIVLPSGHGKTVIGASYLQRNGGKRSLVICPTLLTEVWRDHFARWSPKLKVVRCYGGCKPSRERIEKATIILTTYSVLSYRHDLLTGLSYDTIILDESDTIPEDSQTMKILSTLVHQHTKEVWGFTSDPTFSFGTLITKNLTFSYPWNLMDWTLAFSIQLDTIYANTKRPFMTLPDFNEVSYSLDMGGADQERYNQIYTEVQKRSMADEAFSKLTGVLSGVPRVLCTRQEEFLELEKVVSDKESKKIEGDIEEEKEDDGICSICLVGEVDPSYDPIRLQPCGHHFCRSCLEPWWTAPRSNRILCPNCRNVIESYTTIFPSTKTNETDTTFKDGCICKAEAILKLIETLDDDEKLVVATLSAISVQTLSQLINRRFPDFARPLSTFVPSSKRAKLLKSFSLDDSFRILVVEGDLGKGGIDLTAASHLLIYDNLLPDAIKEGFIDQIHRFGQKASAVTIHSFCVKNSIEVSAEPMSARLGTKLTSNYKWRFWRSIQ